ncbi:uncharacterized protein TRIADDRAFT_62531 [Trichoplax adhaerens]|uniref:Uncharacterized protein n=1 Tax=Trichoplax adhaerens TaxID=10228 RepID=B3SE26_TRIAD|nr:predicted protein [Trichoplax adhaerens]EDV19019.1 predicted protein [Trichoplax adhaerens]|eukprot:XP_002118494.1 predicted protein [Trichoplax adhaerens]
MAMKELRREKAVLRRELYYSKPVRYKTLYIFDTCQLRLITWLYRVMFYPVCMRIEYCSIRTESMLQRDRGIRHEFWHGKASQWLWPYGHGNDQEAIKKVLKVSWDWILFQLDYSIKSSFSCTIDHRLYPSIVLGNQVKTFQSRPMMMDLLLGWMVDLSITLMT